MIWVFWLMTDVSTRIASRTCSTGTAYYLAYRYAWLTSFIATPDEGTFTRGLRNCDNNVKQDLFDRKSPYTITVLSKSFEDLIISSVSFCEIERGQTDTSATFNMSLAVDPLKQHHRKEESRIRERPEVLSREACSVLAST